MSRLFKIILLLFDSCKKLLIIYFNTSSAQVFVRRTYPWKHRRWVQQTFSLTETKRSYYNTKTAVFDTQYSLNLRPSLYKESVISKSKVSISQHIKPHHFILYRNYHKQVISEYKGSHNNNPLKGFQALKITHCQMVFPRF